MKIRHPVAIKMASFLAAIFIRLLEAVVDRAADLLEHVGAEVERLSHSAFGLAEARSKGRAGGQRLRLMLARVGRLGQRLSQIRGVLTGKTGRKLLAHLPGGDLTLEWRESDNHVYMTGPAVEVFAGEWPDAAS